MNPTTNPLSKEQQQKLLKSYVTGFLFSIVLTLVPYFLVSNHLLTGDVLVTFLIIFAFLQLIVQMLYFLHIKEESKPRLNLFLFLSFLSIIIIVVVASIWIMQHLNYNMSLMNMDRVMKQGEGF
jgi:cytochrome o ubiquinol oxidase operon protein cyoD